MSADSHTPDITPDEVDGALEQLWCGHSGELLRLLQRSGDAEGDVDALFGDAVALGMPPPEMETMPTVAHYDVLREIGRGGMGVVYEARQHHPPRLVALKVNRTGHARYPQHLRLFEREIRSLARLRHPHIAAIYDAGFTADGRPYFAMELLEGTTLLEYVRSLAVEGLPPAQRIPPVLSLFERICETISFAHQRGVIHRDLKPSNIFVLRTTPAGGAGSGLAWNATPQIKVLDFGLARITDPESSDTLVTEAGQLRGTLAHMAPENLLGTPGDVDTRGDVYSLGMILCELLTGSLPYNVKNSPMAQVVRTICDMPPIRPSDMNPLLRGDLETIILKAIAKDADQRYASADALAEDIARFRADLPILARPHSAMYQLRKLVARHRIASVAVLVAFMACVMGFAVSAALYARAESAREAEQLQRQLAEQQRDHALAAERRAELHRVEASTEAQRAAAVTSFVADMLSSPDPNQAGRDVRVIDVVDAAAERLEASPLSTPVVEAGIRHVIGLTYMNLGQPGKAEPHVRRAAELRVTHLGDASSESLFSRETLASALSALGKHEEAEETAKDVVDQFMALFGEVDPATLHAMNSLGMILVSGGKLDEAEQWLRRTVDGQSRTLGRDHPDTLVSMSGLGIVLQEKGRLDEAESLFRHVVEQRGRQFAVRHPRRLVAEENLASVLHDQGKLDEAEPIYDQLLRASRDVMGNEHPRTLVLINSLAQLYQAQKKFDAAEQLFKENFETRLRAFGREQQGTLVAVSNLASLYQETGRFSEAEALMRETIAIGNSILPEDHWYMAAFRNNLGACLMKQERWEEAAVELEFAHAGFVQAFGADHSKSKHVKDLLGEIAEKKTVGK